MALSLRDLKGKRLGVCVSGGLDSRTIVRRLKDEGLDVVCFCADLGQADERDIHDVVTKMAPCGAETVLVDLRQAMADACFAMLRAQAQYDGGYWNSTGIGRAVTVRGLINAMQERGCTVLAHGATGRGNDQMRFERYTNALAPDMIVYAPWRDPALLAQFPGRKEMADYLNARGIDAFPGGRKRYSTDANLAGLSYEAEDLESLETPATIVEPQMGVWPHDAPDATETVQLHFERGRLQTINGESLDPLSAMQTANALAGRNGIGMKNALENRIIGTKSRGVYESPGMELLGQGLNWLYMATLDRRSAALLRELSSRVADQVYDGRAFDPMTKAAMAAIDTLAEHATGTVEAGMYKGNLYFVALRNCPASLYNEADASMEASEGLNPVSSQGFAEVQSVEARAMAKARQIDDRVC